MRARQIEVCRAVVAKGDPTLPGAVQNWERILVSIKSAN